LNPLQIALHRWYEANLVAESVITESPQGITFDGQNIWVTHSGKSDVSAVRPKDGVLMGTYSTGAPNTSLGVIVFDGTSLWAGTQQHEIRKLRNQDGSLVAAFHVGGVPTALAFDGANIWVAIKSNDTIVKLRSTDGFIAGTFDLTPGTAPAALIFDGLELWVANSGTNTVSKIRPTDGSFIGTYPVGLNPVGMTFDGANVWVVNRGGNTVSKLKASDGSLVGTYPVGSRPVAAEFDGNNIWVANELSNDVTKLRSSDGRTVGVYPVGESPIALAFDGANIWVANSVSKTISKR